MPSPRHVFTLLLVVVGFATSCGSEVGTEGQSVGAAAGSGGGAGVVGVGTAAVAGNAVGSGAGSGSGSIAGASARFANGAMPGSGAAGANGPRPDAGEAGASGAAPSPTAAGANSAAPSSGSGGGGAPAQGASAGAGAAGMTPAATSGNAAGSAASGGAPAPTKPVTVFIAGDSTVSTYEDTPSKTDQAGWGQVLPGFVKPGTKVENRAIGGRTARRFIDDGKLDEIWKDIREGDYLLVQFGTNDSNKSATYEHAGQTVPYYLDPATDFKDYLKRYIDGARSRKAVPVLVTPPPRNSAYCTGGNGTGAWAQAMRELGTSSMLIVSDLNQRSVDYLKAICPAPDPPDFFLQKPDGTVDGTHFQERGAQKLAEFVADGLRTAGVTWVK